MKAISAEVIAVETQGGQYRVAVRINGANGQAKEIRNRHRGRTAIASRLWGKLGLA